MTKEQILELSYLNSAYVREVRKIARRWNADKTELFATAIGMLCKYVKQYEVRT